LTRAYEEAGEPLRQVGLEDRVERRVTDFAEAGAEVEPADIVVLNRVICCYPDMPGLAGARPARRGETCSRRQARFRRLSDGHRADCDLCSVTPFVTRHRALFTDR